MTGIIEIKINNSIKPLKFGNYALYEYTKLTGADIGNIKEIGDDYTQLDLATDVIFCGLVGACRVNKEVVYFNREDVSIWIDDVSQLDQLNAIKEFYASVVSHTHDMLEALKAMASESSNEKKK